MSNFDKAYAITMDHEGGYVNDPTDSGGETYRGISRRFNPSWEGWVTIDSLKNKPGFPTCLEADILLQDSVKKFFKLNYWDVNKLDDIDSFIITNELFDTGVNMGIKRAAIFLQKTLNLLNKNQKLYNDIAEDGVVGNNTINVLKKCLSDNKEDLIYKILNILQGAHYIDYMSKDPAQEKFALGWFNRVNFNKK